jgi:hypothetical protein
MLDDLITALSYTVDFFLKIFNNAYIIYLWGLYFNVAGFFLGAGIILLVLLSNSSLTRDSTDIVKCTLLSLAVISLANNLGPVYNMILGNPVFQYGTLAEYGILVVDAAMNPLTIALLIGVVYHHYGTMRVRAMFLVLATFLVVPMMYYTSFAGADWWFLIIRAIVLGLFCVAVVDNKYYYSGLLLIFPIYVILKIVPMVIETLNTWFFVVEDYFISMPMFILTSIMESIPELVQDYIIFAVILAVAVLYERVILKVGKKPKAVTP